MQDQLKNVQQIQASSHAFAAVLGDGSVVTWGKSDSGGDSSAVQDQLKNVQQIQASKFAFAAILGDGSVVTWGKSGCGGDSSAVQDQLKNVQQIQASSHAFAGVLGDGSVVTWGHPAHRQTYPRSRPIHRQELQQKHGLRLGSAARSSADLHGTTVTTTARLTPGHDRSIAKNGSKSELRGLNCNFVYMQG